MNQHFCWIFYGEKVGEKVKKNTFWLPGDPGVMHVQVIGIRTEWILQPRCNYQRKGKP